MLSFGERLRIARERRGLSQKEAADAIGVSNKSMSRYENNVTSPDPDIIKSLIVLYGVSSDYILGLSNDLVQTPVSDSKTPPVITNVDSSILKQLSALSKESQEKAAEYLSMLRALDEVNGMGKNVIDLERRA